MQKRLVIILFFITIWLPLLQTEFHFFPTPTNTEKRKLSAFPTTKSLGKWVNDFGDYFSDNFGFRGYLIKGNSYFSAKFFGISTVPIVVIGKDGWLFYKSEATDDGPSINDYQGLAPLSSDELASMKLGVENINRQLADKNIKLYILIGPNKSSIYGQYLPDSIKKINPTTRFDQLKNYVAVVDMRELLKNPTLPYPTYSKTDTHWNSYGAFLVAQKLITKIDKDYPEILPLNIFDYIIKVVPNRGNGDIATMLDLEGKFSDLEIKLVANKIALTNSPKILFFGDSYSPSVRTFLVDRFSNLDLIGIGPSYKFRMDIVSQKKPDIVIWEVAERFLDTLRD